MLLVSPNGVRFDASGESVDRLLAAGFKPIEAKEAPKKTTPARKRASKPKASKEM